MSQPKVRSTIQRLGRTWNPLAVSPRRTTSTTSLGRWLLAPSGEVLPGVAAVDPELLEPPEPPGHKSQHGQAVLGRAGGRRLHGEDQPEGVQEEMAPAAPGLLARVVADIAPMRVALDALAVEDARAGPAVVAHGRAHRGTEPVVEFAPEALAAPTAEDVADRLPRRRGSGLGRCGAGRVWPAWGDGEGSSSTGSRSDRSGNRRFESPQFRCRTAVQSRFRPPVVKPPTPLYRLLHQRAISKTGSEMPTRL